MKKYPNSSFGAAKERTSNHKYGAKVMIFMGWFGPYTYKSKKGVKWWLHSREKGRSTLYFFSKDPENAMQDLPPGFKVIENPRTGMPMLQKKVRPKKEMQ